MNENKKVKVVVFVPEEYANKVREAIGFAGGGKIGNYDFCSFSTKGIGRFKPQEGANPVFGEIGKLESVKEEKIEFLCDKDILEDVVIAIKKVHPYEEVPLDIYSLLDI